LWSRLRDFPRSALTRALERRRAVQATLMRSTIHVVSAGDFPLFAAGVRRGRREWWLRTHRGELDGRALAGAAARLRQYLAGEPRRAEEIKGVLADWGYSPLAWSGVGLWVDLVRVPPSGTWERRRADLYGLAQEWLGPSRVSEAAGRELLVRRYLGGFGPAPIADVASWAGLPSGVLEHVARGMALRHFRDERGGELLDVPRAPLPGPDAPAPVRFLPTWENALLVHARRTQLLPERYRSLVFDTRTPHSVPTFLIDGAVAGSWRFDGRRVRIEPFDPPLPRTVRRELEEEAGRLAAFHLADP
jgi:DNA glycosylase AlkZ-like